MEYFFFDNWKIAILTIEAFLFQETAKRCINIERMQIKHV